MNDKVIGFLSRLRKDTGGNVLAMSAAMVVPMIGLVGGAVDMSRLYATKTRLQAACDAGALAGRRTMGTSTWAANSNRANTQAVQAFNLNFPAGSFASTNAVPNFTEAAGTVTGAAQADVPMTLMRLFGTPTGKVSVSCSSKMVIPNTDVMFVLDTTGSMDDNNKIGGLKKAVKCFYEALAKENTDAVCETTSGETPPSGGISSAVQLRFGFMPYATNVNVGKLLPTKYFADNWDYQSRELTTTPQWTWALGDFITDSTTTSTTNGTEVINPETGYSGFSNTGSGITIGDNTYPRRPSVGAADCAALNTLGPSGNKIVAYYDNVTTTTNLTNTNPARPVYNASNPPGSQTATVNETQSHNLTGYRYVYSNNRCNLQDSNVRKWTQTRNGTWNRKIVWTKYDKVTGFIYKQRSLNVSGLKKSATEWNDTIDLPIKSQNVTVKLSGDNVDVSLSVTVNATATWNGCIEDAHEPQNVTWSSGIPNDAYGAQIDLIPSSSNTQTLWAPTLSDVVWGRYDSNGSTISNVTTTSDLSHNINVDCPSQAAKLQSWTKDDFEDYVDGLTTGGNTYHDVGLVWGGRFASPDGIFADENKTTKGGAQIFRHMIFMTDGDTNTNTKDYTSEGVAWWDRRRTNVSPPSNSDTNAVVNARFAAICTAIKAKGIILWVVSYGGDTNSTTNARLRTCSSDPNTPSTRFFTASDTASLISTFKSIANQISSLRLTS